MTISGKPAFIMICLEILISTGISSFADDSLSFDYGNCPKISFHSSLLGSMEWDQTNHIYRIKHSPVLGQIFNYPSNKRAIPNKTESYVIYVTGKNSKIRTRGGKAPDLNFQERAECVLEKGLPTLIYTQTFYSTSDQQQEIQIVHINQHFLDRRKQKNKYLEFYITTDFPEDLIIPSQLYEVGDNGDRAYTGFASAVPPKGNTQQPIHSADAGQ